VNSTAPAPTVTGDLAVTPEQLAIIGTLARTYDAMRRRLLARLGDAAATVASIRPLAAIDDRVQLDGAGVAASIVDLVIQAPELTGSAVDLPVYAASPADAAAEAGWWDALLGDVERRSGLAPRGIKVTLPAGTPDAVRAVFAERASS
jgi:hypothetical protein